MSQQPGRAGARVAALLACLFVFAFLAWQLIAQGPLNQVDQRVTLWLAAHRQPALTTAMEAVSDLHRTVVLLAITALLAAWFGRRHHPRWVLMLFVVPTGMLLNDGLKNLFHRARPVLDHPLVHYATYSFPSGHAAGSTVFYGALCAVVFTRTASRRARAAAVIASMAMVLLVCFSRVYLGAHYLTDVSAAVAVGLAWLLVWTWAFPPVPRRAN